MNPEAIQLLFNYNYWAFEKTWVCIFKLTDQQFTQEINYSQGSIRHQMVHTMSATNRWIDRLSDLPLSEHYDFENFFSPQQLYPTWKTIENRVLAFVFSLDETLLNSEKIWEITSRNISQKNQLWEILLHVTNHLMDHRTQILFSLNRDFGINTPEHDLLFYLTEHKK